MESIRPNHPLRRLFSGLVEHAFCAEVGVCDPALTEYVSDLLVDFIHVDRLEAIHNVHGKRLDQVAAMLVAMSDEQPTSVADRDRSMRSLPVGYTLILGAERDATLRAAAAAHPDVKKAVALIEEGQRLYPEYGGLWRWAVLKQCKPSAAPAMAAAARQDKRREFTFQITAKLAPMAGVTFVERYWWFLLQGEDAKAIAVLQQFAKEGVPLPIDLK